VPVCVIVNVSSSDTRAQLAKHGVDYMFTTGSKFHPHGAEGIYRHVKYIADPKNLLVMVHDRGIGIEIELALLKRMADNILTHIILRQAFTVIPSQDRTIRSRRDGKDQMNFLMLPYGVKGMTSAASCVLPAEQFSNFKYVNDGRIDEA
jgi:dihydrodipicolinate synthase/N-acetylneuraminate lyase